MPDTNRTKSIIFLLLRRKLPLPVTQVAHAD